MTTFCTPSLDRRSESRDDPAVVAQLWDGESARLLLVDGDHVVDQFPDVRKGNGAG